MKKRTLAIHIDFRQRKYRMILGEICLLIVFLALNHSIGVMFPIVSETVQETEPWYGLYLFLALLDIVLLGAMFFVSGLWFAFWYSEREVEDPDES